MVMEAAFELQQPHLWKKHTILKTKRGYDGDFPCIYLYMDVYGRLNVMASAGPFHVRRILAHALDVSKSKIRVIKARIGGGFGAKADRSNWGFIRRSLL